MYFNHLHSNLPIINFPQTVGDIEIMGREDLCLIIEIIGCKEFTNCSTSTLRKALMAESGVVSFWKRESEEVPW